MVTVLHTHSVSQAEGARLALEGAGIEAVVLDQYSPGALGVAGSLRVAIVHDADLREATSIMTALQPATGEALPSWWWHKRALATLALALIALVVGSQTANSSTRPVLTLGIVSAGALLFVTAVVLFALGFRADKRNASREAHHITE